MKARRFILRSQAAVDSAVEAIQQMHPSGHRLWEVVIRPYEKKRTSPQNNTLHMWLGEMARHTGATTEQMKEWAKQDPDIDWPKELVHTGFIAKSSKHLSAEECMDLMTRLQAHCAEWGIPLTDPIPWEMRDLADRLTDR